MKDVRVTRKWATGNREAKRSAPEEVFRGRGQRFWGHIYEGCLWARWPQIPQIYRGRQLWVIRSGNKYLSTAASPPCSQRNLQERGLRKSRTRRGSPVASKRWRYTICCDFGQALRCRRLLCGPPLQLNIWSLLLKFPPLGPPPRRSVPAAVAGRFLILVDI